MNAKIKCESKLNQGTKFTISNLKLAISNTEPNLYEKKSSNWKIENPNKIHILLVEDNKINQMVIKNLLSKYGYKLTIANDGEEGVKMWKNWENHFSFILMDLRMPIKDGYQATAEIRQIEKEQSIEETPIIALTASDSKEEMKMAASIGMNEYLTKPINVQLLEEAIWRVLNIKNTTGNISNLRRSSTDSNFPKMFQFQVGSKIQYSFLPPEYLKM